MARLESCLLCWLRIALVGAFLTGATSLAADAPVVLENDRVSLEIDPVFGTIGRILDKSSGIALASVPSLAENFRLDLLMPDKTTATVLGKDQRLSGVERTSGGLTLRWNGPLKDTAGAEHKAVVRMDVKAAGNSLEFGLHLENRADGKVRNACYPMIGGLAKFGAPGKPADGVLWVPTSTSIDQED